MTQTKPGDDAVKRAVEALESIAPHIESWEERTGDLTILKNGKREVQTIRDVLAARNARQPEAQDSADAETLRTLIEYVKRYGGNEVTLRLDMTESILAKLTQPDAPE